MSEHSEKVKKIFTLAEAQALCPEVKRLTETFVKKAAVIEAEMIALSEDSPQTKPMEDAYQALLQEWAERMISLGCEVKGVWLVDFDNGEGYYCWKYPEESLEYFHDYSSGFSGRIKITE